MSLEHVLNRSSSLLVAILFTFVLAVTSVLAASQFEGTWSTQDTKGNPFKITLSADGKATGNRADEGLTGTWTAEGDAAVINWNSGWVTKIVKQGDGFAKQAFEKGEGSGSPAHTSVAHKM